MLRRRGRVHARLRQVFGEDGGMPPPAELPLRRRKVQSLDAPVCAASGLELSTLARARVELACLAICSARRHCGLRPTTWRHAWAAPHAAWLVAPAQVL